MDRSVRLMYGDIYEVDVVMAMKKLLIKGDTFIDVGANIGYISAVGLGIVGKEGQVHSFEPVPEYFRRLEKLQSLNPSYRIVVNQCALGEKRTITPMNVTNLPNIGWNTLVPGMMERDRVKETVSVEVQRLDEYISERQLNNIGLIKIDTEGYEFPVLKGCVCYFENSSHRPALLVEIAPSAYHLLGMTLSDLQGFMTGYGYRSVHLDDSDKPIDISALLSTTNVLFLPSSQCS